MKIKLDYVTNSSSVSFYFLFKGRLAEDLFPILRKYEEYFKLETEINTCNCDVEDIIEDIKSLQARTDYVTRYIRCPRLIKKDFQHNLSHLNEMSAARASNKKDDFLSEYINRYEVRVALLNKAEERNMRRCIFARWGDSDGEFMGDTGQCMDYTNGNLLIDEDDLIVFTINDH